MLIRPYPNEWLETWRTGRLGCLYMNTFMATKKDLEDITELEIVTKVLSTRPFEERKNVFLEIERHFNGAVYSMNKKVSQLYSDMLIHYVGSVMQSNQD